VQNITKFVHENICVQFEWFLTKKIFHFGMLKMGALFITQSHLLLESMLNRTRCFITTQTIFSVGLWLIGCYLVIWGATHFQVFVAVGQSLGSETVLSCFCILTFQVYPLVLQDNIQSAIIQLKRLIQAVIQENGGPIQHYDKKCHWIVNKMPIL
jgi:hypothetical protein